MAGQGPDGADMPEMPRIVMAWNPAVLTTKRGSARPFRRALVEMQATTLHAHRREHLFRGYRLPLVSKSGQACPCLLGKPNRHRRLGRPAPTDAAVNAPLARSRAVFQTPTVLGTLRSLRDTLDEHMVRVDICIEEHTDAGGAGQRVRDRAGSSSCRSSTKANDCPPRPLS